jgi:hypothetical protein
MSVSEYVRMIVAQHLKEMDPVTPANQGSNSGTKLRDPVLDRELQDFAHMLDELEGEVSMCDYKLDQLQRSIDELKRGYKVNVNYYEINNVGEWVKRLNEKWHRYKRWYYSLKSKAGLEDVIVLGERFVKIKDNIDKIYMTYREVHKVMDANRNRIRFKVD